MAFNPILETNIQPTQQAERPSAATAVVGLLDSLGTFKQPSAPPSSADMKAQDRVSYFNAIAAADQIRANGDTARANEMVTNALRTWSGKYGLDDAEVARSAEAFTGFDPTRVAYGHDSRLADIKAQPNYPVFREQAAASLPPGATEEDIEAEAIFLTRNHMVLTAKVEDAKKTQEWSQMQPVYEEKTREFATTARDMISQFTKDSIITVEESRTVRQWFTDYTANLTKPEGMTDKDWQEWRNTTITPIQEMINLSLDKVLEGGPTTDVNRAMSGIWAAAVTQNKIPGPYLAILSNPNTDPSQKMAMLSALAGVDNPSKWVKVAQDALNMTYEESLAWVQEFETADISFVENKLDASGFNASENQEEQLRLDTVMARSPDNGEAAIGMINLTEKLKAIPDTTVAANLMSGIFNGAYFTKLEELIRVNPEVGKAILGKTNEALAIHRANAEARITSIARQNGFEIARNASGNYNFMLNRDLLTPAAVKELDEYFGGSIVAAMKARGVAGTTEGGIRRNFGVPLTPNLRAAFETISGLQPELTTYAKVMDAYNKLNGKINPTRNETEAAAPEAVLGTEFAVPEEVAKDTDFINSVKTTSSNLQIQPDWLLRVIDFETASTWSPQIRNPGSTATGLIQFLDSTAKGIGTTVEDLATMSRAEQMAYVEKYLEPYKGKLNNFGDVYMAVHWPAGIGKDEGYVMYRKGSPEYTANRNLDSNGDGTVTRGETLARVLGATGRGEMIPFADHSVGTAATGPVLPEDTGGPYVDIRSSAPASPAPSIQGIDYRPTQPEQPAETNTKFTQAPSQAIPQNVDPEVQMFINSLTQRYEASKTDSSKQFKSDQEMLEAKAAGKIESGDVVLVNGKPRLVP